MKKESLSNSKASNEVNINSFRMDSKKIESKKDFVAIEIPLHILINQTHYATIVHTPGFETELAVGHLISEGIIQSLKDINEIKKPTDETIQLILKDDIDLKSRLLQTTPFARIISSSCNPQQNWPLNKLIDRIKIPRVKSELKIHVRVVFEAIRRLNTLATNFKSTGGVHAASIQTFDGKLLGFAEDVGRHNAVDKVIGHIIMKKIKKDFFLALTGRLTGDIVLKAARTQIPLIASIAAAIDTGINVAKKTNITLIGFVRGIKMNIYTNPDRLIY